MRASRYQPKASPVGPLLGVVALVGGLGAIAYVATRPTPPPAQSVPRAVEARRLTDAERATLVAGARAISHGRDPHEAGLDATTTIAWRSLTAAIERGDVGPRWPTFRQDVFIALKAVELAKLLAATEGAPASTMRDSKFVAGTFDDLVSALDRGDLAAAKAASDRIPR